MFNDCSVESIYAFGPSGLGPASLPVGNKIIYWMINIYRPINAIEAGDLNGRTWRVFFSSTVEADPIVLIILYSKSVINVLTL